MTTHALRAFASLLATLLLTTPILAQDKSSPEAARRSVLGRLVDAKGKPWSDATIHFFSRPLASIGFGDPDHVRCTSNDRGRFRAKLVSGRNYSAWAIGAGPREHWASFIAEDVFAGTPLRLEQDPHPRPPTRFVVQADAFHRAALSKYRVRFVAPMNNQFAVEASIEAREFPVPTLPGRIAIAEVLDANGRPILAHRFLTTLDQGIRQSTSPGPGTWVDKASELMELEHGLSFIRSGRVRRFRLRLRRPQTRTVHVMAAKGEKDIEGAVILGRMIYSTSSERFEFGAGHRSAWIELGRTGRDGRAKIAVPDSVTSKAFWADIVLAARADGFVETQIVVNDLQRRAQGAGLLQRLMGSQAKAEAKIAETEFRLAEVKPQRMQLQVPDAARDLVRERVLRIITPQNLQGPERWSLTVIKRRVRTDASGRFTLPAIFPGRQCAIQVAVDAPLRALLGIEDAPMPMSTALLALKQKKQIDFPSTIDLAKLHCADLEIVSSDGSPARAARVMLVPKWSERLWDAQHTDLILEAKADRRGRVRFVVARGSYDLLIRDDARHEGTLQQLPCDPAHTKLQRIPLKPMLAVRGQVVDKNSRGVPQARVRLGLSMDSMESELLQTLLSDIGEQSTTADEAGVFTLYFFKDGVREVEIEGESPDGRHETEIEVQPRSHDDLTIELGFELSKRKRRD